MWLAGAIVVLMVILFTAWGRRNSNGEGAVLHEPPPQSKGSEMPQPKQKSQELLKTEGQLPAEQAKNKREEHGLEQKDVTPRALANGKPSLMAGASMTQRPAEEQSTLATGQKAASIKKNKPEAVRSGEEKSQVSRPALERSAVKELETIGLFELDARLSQEYGKEFERLSISGIPENVNAFGQISVLLNVDVTGRVALQSLDTPMLTVDPLDLRARVRDLISLAFTQVRLPAPQKRNGQSAMLGKWRLSFKIATLAGKMTLIKQ
jgi:hypothetical protein